MENPLSWLKRKAQLPNVPAERSIGRELTSRDEVIGIERRLAEAQVEKIQSIVATYPKLRDILDDIDFKEVEHILHEHIRRSADGKNIRFDPIAGKEDIFMFPQHQLRGNTEGSETFGSASGSSRTIRVLDELAYRAGLEEHTNSLYELTPEQQRVERIYAKLRLLATIFHEEVHLIGKWVGKTRGLAHGEDFRAVMEGVTEIVAWDLVDAYMHRRGFQEFSGNMSAEYRKVRHKIRGESYPKEMSLVQALTARIAQSAGVSRATVMQSFVRGHVRGLDLGHPQVELAAAVGEENFALLKKAQPGSADVETVRRKIIDLSKSGDIEKSPLKELYKLLEARDAFDLWMKYDDAADDISGDDVEGVWNYEDASLKTNIIRQIIEQADPATLSDAERESRNDILASWYNSSLFCAIHDKKDKRVALTFASKALEYAHQSYPEEPDVILEVLVLLVADKFEEAEKYAAAISDAEKKEDAIEWIKDFRAGKFF